MIISLVLEFLVLPLDYAAGLNLVSKCAPTLLCLSFLTEVLIPLSFLPKTIYFNFRSRPSVPLRW